MPKRKRVKGLTTNRNCSKSCGNLLLS